MTLFRALGNLNPFGPIFGKELRVSSRKKRTYALRVAYLGALLMIMGMIYSTEAIGASSGVAAQNQRQVVLGQSFFVGYGVFSVFVMGILGPMFTATAVNSEQRAKTLPVLLMTPISAFQIVSGKLFSRTLTLITLIGLGMPVLALVRLLGGVELRQMVAVVVLAVIAALSTAAVGLLFSTVMRRAYAVLLLAYALLGTVYLLCPFAIIMMYRNQARPPFDLLRGLMAANPYFTVSMIANPESRRFLGDPPWEMCGAVHLGASFVLLALAALILRRRARSEGSIAVTPIAETPVVSVAPAASESQTVPYPLPSSQAPSPSQKPTRRRTVSDNPILWRELRQPLMPKRWQRVMGLILTFGLAGLIYYSLREDLHRADDQAGWACIFNFILCMMAAVFSATVIVSEKESDTWTLLLATPLSGRTIVWGKALGTAQRLFVPLTLVALHFAAFVFAGVISVAAALIAMWTIVTFNLLWIATGVYFSMRLKKANIAVVVNLSLVVAAYVGSMCVAGGARTILEELPSLYPNLRKEMTDWILMGFVISGIVLSTIWLAIVAVTVLRRRTSLDILFFATLFLVPSIALIPLGLGSIDKYHLNELSSWHIPFRYLAEMQWAAGFSPDTVGRHLYSTTSVLGVGLLYLAVAAIILELTGRKFSELVGRAPQREPLVPSNAGFPLKTGEV